MKNTCYIYFTERKIKYADLVIPFTKCPFKKVEPDCPFVEYWKLASVEKQIQIIEDLPEKELDLLREHHRLCQERKMRNARSWWRLRGIIGIFNKDMVFEGH
ncbi:hypothetical protein [Maribellus maritimus]|uniref:hypothetical protein n=1 Tax=Maribellus maritimus TaxID=2870838 RepID=UPI001EEA85B4|nr:hypothetical protein [Maribellus maritimus]MCG6191174.1 hypothetical protein [Maribellus maritimus]